MSTAPPDLTKASRSSIDARFARARSVRVLIAPIAGELMPGQSQLDQSLPVVAFGGCGPLHCGFSLVLWVVLGTHEANTSRTKSTSRWQFHPYECGVVFPATRIRPSRADFG